MGSIQKSKLYIFCGFLLLALLLSACGSSVVSTQGGVQQNTNGATPAITASGTFKEYPLPQSNSGMMRPAIDGKGRVWFGEMGHNYLGVFDPRAQTIKQMTPPHGASGIMGIVAAPDDTIWFAEQYANYIAHYFPDTNTYRLYTLPTLSKPDPSTPGASFTLPSAPNDLALDAQGNIWFTEMNADSLAMLDTHSGQIKQYPLTAQKSIQKLNPYGITVDPHGIVWFTQATNAQIGRLDPKTGSIQYFSMPGSTNPLMEVASDPQGTIWATSFYAGQLLRFQPATGTFTAYYAPSSQTVASALYGLAISTSGEIWVTVSADNIVARLDTTAGHFVYYHLPTAGSLPFGIVVGPNHTLWFTEAGTNRVGMLQP